jgi:HK97 gp10 family phage protein
MSKTVDLSELQSLMNDLKKMGQSLDQKEVKEIVREIAQPMINDMKAGAPTSEIRESLGFIEKNEEKYTETVLIGPRYYGGHKGQLSHIFEFGTGPRKTKDGYYRGFIVARPFIRPAFDSNKDKIVTKLADELFKIVSTKLKAK